MSSRRPSLTEGDRVTRVRRNATANIFEGLEPEEIALLQNSLHPTSSRLLNGDVNHYDLANDDVMIAPMMRSYGRMSMDRQNSSPQEISPVIQNSTRYRRRRNGLANILDPLLTGNISMSFYRNYTM